MILFAAVFIALSVAGAESAGEPRFEPLRSPLFGLAILRQKGTDVYRTVDVDSGRVVVEGTLEACEEALLETLEGRYGSGRLNIPFQTLGGKQFWADQLVHCGWRIQEHVYTGHCRLLSPEDIRQTWGTFEACRVALERVKIEKRLRPRSDHMVILLHGLFRSRASFRPMAEELEREGYEVASINYPSTRRTIAEHADQVDKILENVDGAATVSFVTHSLGGLVARELLSRRSPWRERIRLGRLVMLGPPNRGSIVADLLEDWAPFEVAAGEVGRELSPEQVAKIPLPACGFGIIAGGTGGAVGINPVIPGDNDGVVTVESTRIPGAEDFLVLRVLHSTMMRDDEVIAATIRFLRTGRFSGRAGQPGEGAGPTERGRSARARVESPPSSTDSIPWHHGLCLDGGGYWRRRVPLAVRNDGDRVLEGEPASVRIGHGPSEADLEGFPAEGLRVATEAGVEMRFSLEGPSGERITRGPVPAGADLTIPIECPARSVVRYFAYFDNPGAWVVPDFLDARARLTNGGLEEGEGDVPRRWEHAASDQRHRPSWSEESPRSGRRCLKTVVDAGAEATWVQTRQSRISVQGGARYALSGWVKAREVQGAAGWYIHLGNEATPMAGNHVLSGGGGTYDWKEVRLEIAAPPDARSATIGTVLHGTGTAWFDDVALEPLGGMAIEVTASRPEELCLEPPPAAALAWHEGADAAARGAWELRARVRLFPPPGDGSAAAGGTLGGRPGTAASPLVCADVSELAARFRRPRDEVSLLAVAESAPLGSLRIGDALLFEAPLEPGRLPAIFVYARVRSARPSGGAGGGRKDDGGRRDDAGREDPGGGDPVADFERLSHSERNLLRNSGFEEGDPEPAGWSRSTDSAAGVEHSLDGGARLGRRAARLHVPRGAPSAWRGWTQDVAVEPGSTYLYAAWLRSRDLEGEARIHAHFRRASGELVPGQWAVSAGPGVSGTSGWTLASGIFEAPPEASTFQVHLTLLGSGTLWHDGALVARVERGALAGVESRPASEPPRPVAWPVNAIVKAFREDLPPPAPSGAGAARPATVHAARGEKEPLQIAIRSARAIPGVSVRVDPPRHASGATLGACEVGVVGYVPIDHKTSYYSSPGPSWRRLVPAAPGDCDGWAGWWPDPLLPQRTFDLAERVTQPVWITVSVPEDAPAGEYGGAVRFERDGDPVAEVPFTVRVRNFALPARTSFKAIYDLRVGPEWTAPGRSEAEVWRDLCRFLAERRLCPDTIQPPPRIWYRDGRASADFSEFDRSAALWFDELKLPHAYTPWSFYLFGWGFPPGDKFGEAPYEGRYPFEAADRSKLRPEFRRAYQACLKAYWDHLRERGWAERCILYISDEPFFRERPILDQMKALCDMIHEVDPAIPIYSSTWHHVPEWDGRIDVWGISHSGLVSPETIAGIRARGGRIIWTTDGQMCTDTPYCAVERLLPHHAFHHGAEGYEFWGATWLTYDPYRFGWHAYIPQSDTPGKSYFIRYPNGDGFLCYPGKLIGLPGPVSSIRLEQAREGVEDHEYLRILSERIAAARAAGRETAEAEAALREARALAPIPNAGGRHSTRLLPDPDAVFRVKDRVATAIEKLGPGGMGRSSQ